MYMLALFQYTLFAMFIYLRGVKTEKCLREMCVAQMAAMVAREFCI